MSDIEEKRKEIKSQIEGIDLKLKRVNSQLQKLLEANIANFPQWPEFLNNFNFFAFEFGRIQKDIPQKFRSQIVFPSNLDEQFRNFPERMTDISNNLRTKMHPDIEKEEKELLEKHPAPPSKNPKIDLKKMKDKIVESDKLVVALHERLVKTRQKLIEASAPTHDLMKAGEILQNHTQTVGNVLQSVSAGTGLPTIPYGITFTPASSVINQNQLLNQTPVTPTQNTLKRKLSNPDLISSETPTKKFAGQNGNLGDLKKS
jgi:hypothetical protein